MTSSSIVAVPTFAFVIGHGANAAIFTVDSTSLILAIGPTETVRTGAQVVTDANPAIGTMRRARICKIHTRIFEFSCQKRKLHSYIMKLYGSSDTSNSERENNAGRKENLILQSVTEISCFLLLGGNSLSFSRLHFTRYIHSFSLTVLAESSSHSRGTVTFERGHTTSTVLAARMAKS